MKSQEDIPSSLTGYLFSDLALWFWVVFSLSVLASVLVFLFPDDSFPLVYIRSVFGTVFVLFLPGYSLIKILFSSKELDKIERVVLSIGVSLALVSIVGLLLNYTPWGIRVIPLTFCLLGLTLVFALVAVIQEYKIHKKMILS